MKSQPVMATILLAVVALGGFLAGYTMGQPDYVVAPYDGNVMRVELYIYKNGELVYYDPDDPATNNFIAIITSIADGPDTLTSVSGTTFSGVDTLRYGSRVAVSNGTATFTRSMNVLPGTVWYSASPLTVSVLDNAITMTGSITVDVSTTITWVGLELRTDPGNAADTANGYWILVFADQLSQPITVNAGDVITVVYKIVVP